MRRVVLLLFVLLTQVCVTSYAQSRQTSLRQIDQEFQLYRKGADERIQKYIRKNPQALVSFKRNNAVYLMVDVSESGIPLFERTDNAQEATTVNVPALRTGGSLGINILGTGIRLGTWDGGRVRNDHIELVGRVTQVDGAASFDDHATHTTGTMMATGINPSAKGMAPEATLSAFDFNNDVTEMTSQAKPDQTTLLLSNHSYGNVAGWESTSGGNGWTWNGDPAISTTVDYKFGFYDTKSNQWDAIAVSAPYYAIVKSAGNDRSDVGDGSRPPDGAPNGYDCIPTFGVAKNIITVGAVQNLSSYTGPADVVMTSFSSWGPTDDGRIKPDIVAPGLFVFSTISTSTNAYGNLSGTSMSSPVVTGSLALLQQLYKSLNSGNFMRSATAKALILHTAREAGANPGPDYSFGWGLLDAEAAARVIINKDNQNIFIREAVLTSGQPFEITLTPKAGPNSKITATLVWTDPAGTPPAPSLNPTNRMLVNDLDLRLVDDGGTNQFPWILNPVSPAAAATTGDNTRDNVEKIEFGTPQPRTYKLRVTNKGTLVGTTQPFSLILTYESVVDPLITYYWIGNSGNWNDGTHWSLASNGVPANIVPGANDRVVFDENSFTSNDQVVTLTDNRSCFSLRWFAKEPVSFSLSSNTLSLGESMTFVTDKITTSTPGTINLTSASTNTNSVDLDANNFTNWNLNFTGNSSWAITGSASVNQINVSQGTVTFAGSNLRVNQLSGTGSNAKTVAFANGSTLQAAQGLNVDFTGVTLQADSLSSIVALPSVTNSINLP
ncbi:MAG: S8 family serine peptidase, partial [Cyclobacteriaceae bacterium]|nr:S8 family serine peptidase [Cyclobacteriaceae bacterium]